MIVAVTGHRPEEIIEEIGFVEDAFETNFRYYKPDEVVVGMAAGIDLLAGVIAVDLGLSVVAARPWAGHTPRKGDELAYEYIIKNAKEVVNVDPSDTYAGPWVYHKRNEYMVDRASHVLAYYNGASKGGTAACVKYASKVKKPIKNLYNYHEGTFFEQ